MTPFTDVQPNLENYWRSIILFGRNVASYKFALGKSLLELSQRGKECIALGDLAEPFSRHLCEHLQLADKQATSKSSRFLDVCRKFNAGGLKQEELDATVKLGYDNVIDAFHIVHDGEIGVRFFTDERRGNEKGIRLTQELFKLTEQFQFRSLPIEIEARWRLVETACALSVPRHVLTVRYDADGELLVINDPSLKRKAITGCRDALNGYQKGKCFYCFDDISVDFASEAIPDVDHFFPHRLKPYGFANPVDGVWNLVLTCRKCNRGPNGKSDKLPELRYLERLHARNGFFIDSHHPLRDTLIQQTGPTEPERRMFLQYMHNQAKKLLINEWRSEYEYAPAF